ncbi:MAG: adenylosuccinate lyase [Candidatus Latescibacterota bacterium]|nr:adenylosuccinate lyase [Candidatus Latescibacterota bacterium]
MSPKPIIQNILAQRYASKTICDVWSETGKIKLEREFWIAVLKAQRDLGLQISDESISAYESVLESIDLSSIAQREVVLRHDVKARIEEFCSLAGYQDIHKGLTSRDLTDNVEQFQILRSLKLIQLKYIHCLNILSERSDQWKELVIVGRTHYAAAQPTTLGKRLSMFGEEMLVAHENLDHLISNYPLRGLKGAVGTSLDQLTLLGNDPKKLHLLQEKIRDHLGFQKELGAVGQVYPRSLDYSVVSTLFQLGSGLANLAKNMRLMAGNELLTEGFSKGQVGSSAMPHKMNTRSTERINGLQNILGGYVHMIGSLTGDQWFEGDVSCSVVRRLSIPDSFFAFDGMLETALHVLDEMGVYPAVVDRDLRRYMPFLASTTILMESVQRGAGRETVHEAIKEHAIAAALTLRETGTAENDLPERLGQDSRIPLTASEIDTVLEEARTLTGESKSQVQSFVGRVNQLTSMFPASKQIKKGSLI